MRTKAAARFSNSQQADIAGVCEIGPEKLFSIVDALRGKPLIVSRPELERLFSTVLAEDQVGNLSRLLFGIATALRQNPDAATIVLDAVDARAEADQLLTGWSGCRPAIEQLLSMDSIKTSAKALDVSYDFERIYKTGRILTSIRPIFDDDRSSIVAATVVQTLRLEYATAGGESGSLSIALDQSDVLALQSSCEQAIIKANESLKQITKKWGIPTIVPGGDDT